MHMKNQLKNHFPWKERSEKEGEKSKQRLTVLFLTSASGKKNLLSSLVKARIQGFKNLKHNKRP